MKLRAITHILKNKSKNCLTPTLKHTLFIAFIKHVESLACPQLEKAVKGFESMTLLDVCVNDLLHFCAVAVHTTSNSCCIHNLNRMDDKLITFTTVLSRA